MINSPKRRSPKRRSPKRRSPKRRSLKRRSLKRRSLKRRSLKRRSVKSRSPKRRSLKSRSPKRRSHNMSPKRNKLPNRLTRSIRRQHNMSPKRNKLPNRLTRSFRRQHNMSPKGHRAKAAKEAALVATAAPIAESRVDRVARLRQEEYFAKLAPEEREAETERLRKQKEDHEKAKKEEESLKKAKKEEEARQAKEKRVAKISETISANDRDILFTKLYLNDSEREQDETILWANYVKRKRAEYFREWFRLNNYTKELTQADLLVPNPSRVPAEMQKLRVEFNDYYNDKNIKHANDIWTDGKANLFLGGIAPSRRDELTHNAFLIRKNMIVYSVDSLNKHIVVENGDLKSNKFVCSPYSLEIHCNIIKPEDGGTFPRNFYGHVTLIVIGNVDEDDEVLTKGTDNYKKQIYEKNKYGRTFHYGMRAPLDKENEESIHRHPILWKSVVTDPINTKMRPSSVFPTSANRMWEETFVSDEEIINGITWFPEHNSIYTLLKQYYLKCMYLCLEKHAFKGADESLGFPLTYKDLTNWGLSKGQPAF